MSGVALVQMASDRDGTLRQVADRKVERIIKCSELFFATRLSDICCAADRDAADTLVLFCCGTRVSSALIDGRVARNMRGTLR